MIGWDPKFVGRGHGLMWMNPVKSLTTAGTDSLLGLTEGRVKDDARGIRVRVPANDIPTDIVDIGEGGIV